MNYKRLWIMLVGLMITSSVGAQTVTWSMEPRAYSDIQQINNNLYLVTQNGKIGLINADGTVVAPAVNDRLTPYYEHRALMLKSDGNGERIMGCLTDDGKYHQFSNAYYTLPGMKFYSDGVIGVSNDNGRVGYIDVHGNTVTGFDGRYNKLRPFVNGYAAVFKDKKYFLINKEGQPVKFKFDKVAELYGGTNPYDGKVVVWDTEGKFYQYDLEGGKGVCKSMKKPADTRSFDFLYRLQSVSGSPKEVPYVEYQPTTVKGLMPTNKGGLYGYSDDGKTVLPCQLESATEFADDVAVVKCNGQLGLLRYVNGQGFGINANSEPQRYYGNDEVSCTFSLNVPSVWSNGALVVNVTDSNGSPVDVTAAANTYNFKVCPKGSGTQTYTVIVESPNLKLYEGSVDFAFEKRERCPICHKDKQYCPGHADTVNPKSDGDDESKQQVKDKLCPTCGKPIHECKYQGVH